MSRLSGFAGILVTDRRSGTAPSARWPGLRRQSVSDHVADLVAELWIGRQLPGLHGVGLEVERPPDPRDRRLRPPGRGPLRASSAECVCTPLPRGDSKKVLPWESVTYSGFYRLPPEARTVDTLVRPGGASA
jgi:hypothetical protein